MLGKPGEQYIPPLITGRTWRIPQQSLTYRGWLLVVLLQELHDQPPLPVKVLLGRQRNEPGRQESSAGNSHPQRSERGAVTSAEDASPRDAERVSVDGAG